MPSKKPTYAQRIEKNENTIIEKKIDRIHDDLMKAYRALKICHEDTQTWYWVAIESFKELQGNSFPQKNKLVIHEKNIALQVAREAQAIINFKS